LESPFEDRLNIGIVDERKTHLCVPLIESLSPYSILKKKNGELNRFIEVLMKINGFTFSPSIGKMRVLSHNE